MLNSGQLLIWKGSCHYAILFFTYHYQYLCYLKCHFVDNSTCPLDYFRCENGQCLNKTYICDAHNDCNNGSDEQNCGENTHFICSFRNMQSFAILLLLL